MADGGLLWFNIGLSPRRGGTPDFVNFYIDKGDMALQTVSFQKTKGAFFGPAGRLIALRWIN
jgi:hypothetical protein